MINRITFFRERNLHNIKYLIRANQTHNFCTNNSTICNKHYNIVIAGGGMVGFAAAATIGANTRLADQKILLLESQTNKNWTLPSKYSNRVSALSSHTQKLFDSIGAWKHVESCRLQPVKKMMVWESLSEAMISFDDNSMSDKIPVAHIVENDVILNSLKLQLTDNVEVCYSSKIVDYQLPNSTEEDTVTITFEDGTVISTDLLIGADGANSQVRKAMGSKYLSFHYDQMGIVATLQLSEEQDNFVAWQKFLPTGPVAILPLSSTQSSLVWSMTKDRAEQLLALEEKDFVDALNNTLWGDDKVNPMVRNVHEQWQSLLRSVFPEATGKQLPPSISVAESRAGFPLGLGHAVHYVAPRVALIGDAAHRVHPLAGQGVNLGFGDVGSLVSALETSVSMGCDIGDMRQLYAYETDRQRHNVVSMTAIDSLYRIYSSQWLPVVMLRSLGLSALDVIQPIKKRIMAHAER